jgi:hypothetical protein
MLCPERALWARRHEPGLVCEVLVALFHGVASVGGGGRVASVEWFDLQGPNRVLGTGMGVVACVVGRLPGTCCAVVHAGGAGCVLTCMPCCHTCKRQQMGLAS